MTPDEPNFAKHLRNVLTDLAEGQLDGVDEAYEAIMDHPAMKLVPIAPMPTRSGSN